MVAMEERSHTPDQDDDDAPGMLRVVAVAAVHNGDDSHGRAVRNCIRGANVGGRGDKNDGEAAGPRIFDRIDRHRGLHLHSHDVMDRVLQSNCDNADAWAK